MLNRLNEILEYINTIKHNTIKYYKFFFTKKYIFLFKTKFRLCMEEETTAVCARHPKLMVFCSLNNGYFND